MTCLLLLVSFITHFSLTGEVRDVSTNEPLPAAQVTILETTITVASDKDGRFTFRNVPSDSFTIQITCFGYKPFSQKLKCSADTSITIYLEEEVQTAESIVIDVLRTNTLTSTSQKTIQKEELEDQYFGQEVPILLTRTPSVLSYSDGGNYSGYSYFRLRGIDQTRINFTLNGVPLNEPEDQGVYFSNFPDFVNSIESVQIQRGVGTSSFGVASYGGSVNFESINLGDRKPGMELNLGYGSFNSYRLAAEYKTGRLKNNFAFYGRYSMTGSDGYRYHSGNNSNSFFLSGAWFGKKSMWKLTAFSGNVVNQMAYLATLESDIKKDPRTNYLTESEKDRFRQDFCQLLYTNEINKNWKLTSSVYYTRVAGNYDIHFTGIMFNYSIRTNFVGAFANIHYEKNKFKWISGTNVSTLRRDHWSGVWPDVAYQIYFNSGFKNDVSTFSKWSYSFNKFVFFADLQLRYAQFRYQADKDYQLTIDPVQWFFVNPHAGINYKVSTVLSLYTSLGRSGREPTRTDMFAGFDDLDTSNVGFIGKLDRVKPEHVLDWEFGTYIQNSKWKVQANIFWMQFKNEIAAIGQLSYFGLPLRKNVDRSYRRGIEVDLEWQPISFISFAQNVTLSKNRIQEYVSDIDTVSVTYKDVSPLLTPEVISNTFITYHYKNKVDIEFSGRYVSQSFLDNTNTSYVIPSYLVFNGRVGVKIKERISANFFINNIGNKLYYTSGYVQSGFSLYYVQPPRNYFINLQIKF